MTDCMRSLSYHFTPSMPSGAHNEVMKEDSYEVITACAGSGSMRHWRTCGSASLASWATAMTTPSGCASSLQCTTPARRARCAHLLGVKLCLALATVAYQQATRLCRLSKVRSSCLALATGQDLRLRLPVQIDIEDFRVVTESYGMQLDDDSILAMFSKVWSFSTGPQHMHNLARKCLPAPLRPGLKLCRTWTFQRRLCVRHDLDSQLCAV